MNIPPSTILALMLVGGFIFFIIARVIYRSGKSNKSVKNQKSKTPQTTAEKRKELKDKEEALGKFKKIHAAARDKRKKIAKEIDQNPEKATKVLRSMMKQ